MCKEGATPLTKLLADSLERGSAAQGWWSPDTELAFVRVLAVVIVEETLSPRPRTSTSIRVLSAPQVHTHPHCRMTGYGGGGGGRSFLSTRERPSPSSSRAPSNSSAKCGICCQQR